MEITKSNVIANLQEIFNMTKGIDIDCVVVGGTAAVLHGVPVSTSDVDLFFLLNKNSSTSELKRTLTSKYQSSWHNDGGFWDSHNNLICELPFDFRLIEKKDDV